ncbi:MAG: small multidrug efflux protein, partial [Brevibacterium aurantiacum]
MNSLITFFQGLASHVPELLQPFIIALAGAVPFVEGEVSAVIGVWAGLNPIVAGVAGAIGNFICVTVIVLLGARAREAVVARRSRAR